MIVKILIQILIPSLLTNPFSPPASNHAYLDPGSRRIILQVVLAALLGGLFIVKAYWNKIVGLFRKPKAEPKPGSEPEIKDQAEE